MTHAATLRLAVFPRTLAADIALVTGGVLFVAAMAQIEIPLGFTPVPITGQTFAVMVVGASYGMARGGITLTAYLLAGMALPFYSGGESGWDVATGATGGYLVGFICAAMLTGALAERGWDRRFSSATAAMLAGNLLIYVPGLLWLSYQLDWIGFERTLELGFYPFVPGMFVKLYLAAGLLPAAWELVRRVRGEDAPDELPGPR